MELLWCKVTKAVSLNPLLPESSVEPHLQAPGLTAHSLVIIRRKPRLSQEEEEDLRGLRVCSWGRDSPGTGWRGEEALQSDGEGGTQVFSSGTECGKCWNCCWGCWGTLMSPLTMSWVTGHLLSDEYKSQHAFLQVAASFPSVCWAVGGREESITYHTTRSSARLPLALRSSPPAGGWLIHWHGWHRPRALQ